MNRNDVIDVLTVVAAATRRTVGEADVHIWQGVIGDDDRELALRAVRDHLAECPGVWLEPGHVHQRVRAYVRDQLDREPDEIREARQAAFDARFIDEVDILAARKGVPAPTSAADPPAASPNPLTVRCPWCRAQPGVRCTTPGTNTLLRDAIYHPSRYEAVTA